MSESNTPIVITPIPVYGSVTVISPQDQGKAHPQTYHLRESAIVLIWATRQGHEITAWVGFGGHLGQYGFLLFSE